MTDMRIITGEGGAETTVDWDVQTQPFKDSIESRRAQGQVQIRPAPDPDPDTK